MGRQRRSENFGAQKTLAPNCNRTTILKSSSPEPSEHIDNAIRAFMTKELLTIQNYQRDALNIIYS